MKRFTSNPANLVISILGFTLIVMVMGGGAINYLGRDIPTRYYDIIQAIVVGLLALLAHTSTDPAGTPSDPVSTKVENSTSEPVPTANQEAP